MCCMWPQGTGVCGGPSPSTLVHVVCSAQLRLLAQWNALLQPHQELDDRHSVSHLRRAAQDTLSPQCYHTVSILLSNEQHQPMRHMDDVS